MVFFTEIIYFQNCASASKNQKGEELRMDEKINKINNDFSNEEIEFEKEEITISAHVQMIAKDSSKAHAG